MKYSEKMYAYVETKRGFAKLVYRLLYKLCKGFLMGVDDELNTKEEEINALMQQNSREHHDFYVELQQNSREHHDFYVELQQREAAIVARYESVKNAIEDRMTAEKQDLNKQISEISRQREELQVRLDAFCTKTDELNAQFNALRVKERKLEKMLEAKTIDCKLDTIVTGKREETPEEQEAYSNIDYFDFENHFRGTPEQIKENQQQYLKYFIDKNNIFDLGCGRGEFLEILRENNVKAKGVDLYNEFVDMCVNNGLDVKQGDGIVELAKCENQSLGGVFVGQVVEHLQLEQIVNLCDIAYEKLEKGSYLIMETPNPTALCTFANAFYVDPSHQKPIHPLTLKYLCELAGFSDVEILFTESSTYPVHIPPLLADNVDNLKEFNEALAVVDRLLLGSQDYAILARK